MSQLTEDVRVLQPSAQLIDPHTWTDNPDRLSIRLAVYEPLVRYDEEGQAYHPVLAKAWSLDSDARTWSFELRTDVTFHNGDRLDVKDVIATLDRACDPGMHGELGTQGLYQSYLGDAAIEAVGGHRLRLVTQEPMADLLDILVEIPIVPRGALTDLPRTAVGSGPYRLVEATGGSVVVEEYDGYWGRLPTVKQIRWESEPDAPRRVEALLADACDLVTGLTPDDAEGVEAAEGARLMTSNSSVCAVFMCNLLSGACTDRSVRQALNYALDAPGLVETVMGGAGKTLNGPLTPYHLGHDPTTPPYGYDPGRARVLLSEAGYDGGLRIVLDVPTVLPDRAPALARQMAEQYAEVGISTEVREFADRSAYADMVRAKEIDDACCFDSSPLSTYRVLREKFHSGVHGPWWQGYENPRVDELLDRAAATADTAQRQQLYRRAYRMIREDAPWIFLFSSQHMWGVNRGCPDLETSVDGVIRFG